MKDAKEINALVKKLEKNSKIKYDNKQKELAKKPDCEWCQVRIDLNIELSLEKDKELMYKACDCIPDKTNPKCKFKEVSKEMRKLATWAWMGSMARKL